MLKRKVRVRFAPSPTGPLHLGSMRTALFNFLFARKNNGDFILRIEDTDRARYVAGAEEYIMESLDWCGIKVDEGVKEGGDYGPYRQSERKSIYPEYAQKLIGTGYAYYAFDTPEELELKRKKFETKGETFLYDASIRPGMKNSLVLTGEEVQKRLNSGESYVIRFKIPENTEISINDLVRGKVIVNTSTMDDKVLFKSDGMPTYHLANVVDDYLMNISHVIRGEEWLPSLPLHILLYRAFGWEDQMPEFAHMPLTLKPDGKGKLSKRDGDRLGFPVFPLQWTNPETGEVSRGYKEDGYLPEAFINMLAFLGWNPGTSREIFSMDELIRAFSINRIIKAGSRFDPEKAKWFNQQYLRAKSNKELALLFKPVLKEKGINLDDQDIDVEKVCNLVKERATLINELWDHSWFLFKAPEEYDQKAVKKRWKEQTPGIMKELYEELKRITDFSSANIEKVIKNWMEKKGFSYGQVMNAFRLCIVGADIGPHLFDIVGLLGKKETLARIKTGLQNIKAS
jgi:glutamyl-tRNA synthetase